MLIYLQKKRRITGMFPHASQDSTNKNQIIFLSSKNIQTQ